MKAPVLSRPECVTAPAVIPKLEPRPMPALPPAVPVPPFEQLEND